MEETDQVHSSKIAKASPFEEESYLYLLNLTTEAPGERKRMISYIMGSISIALLIKKKQTSLTYRAVRVVLNYVPTISLNNSIENASLLSGETR